MKILLFTDAYYPQINGVSTTYQKIVPILQQEGHDVFVAHPGIFKTIPSTYPDIRLALVSLNGIQRLIKNFKPDAIHIGVEGPIGLQAKRYCDNRKLRYTTAFHTKYAEYLKEYIHLPVYVGWKLLRWFHGKSTNIMTPTLSMKQELKKRRFPNTVLWSRGVDTNIFKPREKNKTIQRPLLMCVGRVAKEKNLDDFLLEYINIGLLNLCFLMILFLK